MFIIVKSLSKSIVYFDRDLHFNEINDFLPRFTPYISLSTADNEEGKPFQTYHFMYSRISARNNHYSPKIMYFHEKVKSRHYCWVFWAFWKMWHHFGKSSFDVVILNLQDSDSTGARKVLYKVWASFWEHDGIDEK